MTMIWTGNFQAHPADSKKGKATKKTGGNIKSYSANFDFLVGYAPCIAVGTIWRNRDQFWNAFVASQQFQLQGTGTDFSGAVTNNPGPFINILAVTVQKTISATFTDYGATGFPYATTSLLVANTEQAPLYNASYTPLFVLQPGQGQDYCQYFGSDQPGNPNWSVHIDAGITNPVITVYYLYSPDGYPVGLSSSGSNLQLESTLGNGNEFASFQGGTAFQILYPEFFGVGASNFDMGLGDMAPNDNLEVVCMNNVSVNGDATPADFILDIITSGNYWPINPTTSSWAHGLSFLPENLQATYTYAPNILADPPNPAPGCVTPGPGPFSLGLTALRNYCFAYNIFISGAMDSQRTAADWINELCDIGNCVPVWNGSKLNFVPRCEISAIGNGAIYTAPTAAGPIYTITDSAFIAKPGEDPITIVRNENVDPRSIPNLLRVQHKSRGSGFYSDITTTWRDEASIVRTGIVPGEPKNWPFIQDAQTALSCAAPIMRRYWMVEPLVYKFKLPVSHCLLDCYDLVELQAPETPQTFIGPSANAPPDWPLTSVAPFGPLSKIPVRLTSMEEDADRVITCEAEPFFYGAHAPTQQTPAATVSSGFGSVKNAVVLALVNTPIIFEPVTQLTAGVEQIWFAVSDTDANYGGCNIWMSPDGKNYTMIGSLTGNSVMGVTYSGTYPSTPDPDATNTLFVDLTESNGALASFTTVIRDAFTSLCYLDPGGISTINGATVTIPYELIAYATATQQTGNQYSLSPTIRRGVYGTPDVSHVVGSNFAYLGPGTNLFKYNLNPSLIGSPLYFKFQAFNTTGGNPQDLGTLTPYLFTPTGLGQATAPPTGTLTYSLNPAVVLYQGVAGGWPSVPNGSAGWTDPTQVYLANPIIVTWSDGVSVTYNPTSPVAIPGSAPETLYGAIFDPGRTGTGYTFFLDTTNRSGQSGYISLGAINIQNTSTGGASGGGGSTSGNPYDIMSFFNGSPTASYVIQRFVADRSITLPINLTGSQGSCVTAPSGGAVTLPIKKNGSSIGTVNFANAATTATFTFSSVVTLAAGDVLEIDAPSSPDPSFATISITLMGTR